MTEQVNLLEALEVASILTDMRAPLSIKAAAILRTLSERIAALEIELVLAKPLYSCRQMEARLADALAALTEIGDVHRGTPCLEGLESDRLLGRLLRCREIADATLSRLTAGEKKGGMMSDKTALERMAEAALELAMYASYAEIVGGISQNRPQIRKWCDKVFALNHECQDAKWAALDPSASEVHATLQAEAAETLSNNLEGGR